MPFLQTVDTVIASTNVNSDKLRELLDEVDSAALRYAYTQDQETLLGYVWTTRIYQQSQNMIHFPR